MEKMTPGSRDKLQISKAPGFAAWAAFYLPDRASLKSALFGPVAASGSAPALSGVSGASNGQKPLRRGSEGQALVEFALTLPFLVILFVVLVELGLLIRSHMTVTGAVREGVRAVSSRGNADPSALVTGAGHDVNSRVGTDGDLLLTQNVNTALQQERANVTLLMTYRADVSDGPTQVTDPTSGRKVPTSIGYYGIGGQYGVVYSPTLSLYPFQEVFSYTVQANSSGVPEKFFYPSVMSVNECFANYGTSEPADPAASTPAGNTYGGAAFCGDASNVSGVKATQGISRNIPLGTYDANSGNASAIYSKARYSGGVNCQKINSGSNPNDVLYLQTSSTSSSAIQCWRYNFAPWYPALRYSLDFTGNNVNVDPTSAGYYNYQKETPDKFGDPSVFRSPDYAGVQIVYTHKWVLSFFPGSLTLSDKAVKVMEPVGGGFSKPGT
jgi:Flp pilus assembly protein TadG